MIIHDLDTTLSDWVLAIISAYFCLKLNIKSDKSPRNLFFFMALTSLFGGIYHGFFLEKTSTTLGYLTWISTLLSLGFTSIYLWRIGFNQWMGLQAEKYYRRFWKLLFVYSLIVIFVDHRFLIGILFYIPPSIFLFGVLLQKYQKTNEQYAFFGIIGLLLTFLSAFLQQYKIALHPVYFTHNAVYHLVQGLGIVMLYKMLIKYP